MPEFFKKQLQRIYWRYYRLRNLWPVWYYFLNYGSRIKWNGYLESNKLSDLQLRISDELSKNGIAITHISEFFKDGKIFAQLKNYTKERLSDPVIQKEIAVRESGARDGKGGISVHLIGGYGDSKYEIDLTNPFLRFHLARPLLETASSYMGLIPKFIMHSLHSMILIPPDSPAAFSQNWHRDPDDKKIIKIFIYLTDVNEASDGPFMYVKGSQYGGRWRNIFPQVPPVGSYPPRGAVEKIVPGENIEICLGKAGTIIFCDTSGLHKGGYCTKSRRIMSAATFVSSASAYRPNFDIGEYADLSNFSEIARYALDING